MSPSPSPSLSLSLSRRGSVVVLLNLKPAEFKGIKSEGMMLVGDQQKPTKLQGLISPGNAAPGTKVECPGAHTIVADNMELKVFLAYTIYNDIHNTQ